MMDYLTIHTSDSSDEIEQGSRLNNRNFRYVNEINRAYVAKCQN